MYTINNKIQFLMIAGNIIPINDFKGIYQVNNSNNKVVYRVYTSTTTFVIDEKTYNRVVDMLFEKDENEK